MESLKALMSKKIAGIPVIYIAGLFVAILVIVAWRMKSVSTTESKSENTETDDSNPFSQGDPSNAGSVPTFVANPAPGYLDPNASQGASSIDDNIKWLRRSIEWLVAQGHASVDQATVALQKYLSGSHLSVNEGKLRDLAIGKYGLPPELPESGGTDESNNPLPPSNPTPTNPNPETFKPPGYYTTSEGDTWTSIATKYYGNGSNEAVDYLQSWNVRSGAPHSGKMRAGIRLFIPNYQEPKYIKATATMRTAADIIKKNPPLNSTAMLEELNDGMKFPVPIGTRVRVL